MIQHAINALATYRITRILHAEDAPYELAGKLRDLLGVEYDELSNPYGRTELAKIAACPLCLSLWVGWGVAFASGASMPVFAGFAYSGFSTLCFLWEAK